MNAKRLKARTQAHSKNILTNLAVYFLLIGIGFVFLYPLLYMIITSLMTTEDLINPTIKWLPTHLDLTNFKQVWQVLDYPISLFNSAWYSLICSLAQTFSCALAGYALARFSVPAKKFWIVMLIIIFIIPANVVTIPRYVLFNNYQLVGSPLATILPALTGQGLKSSIFVFIFMSAFSAYPRAFDEAAQLDGAGNMRIFFRIALPMTVLVIVLSLVFSLVWYWNDVAQCGLLIGDDFQTLPLELKAFDAQFSQMFSSTFGDASNRLNERYQMTATIMVIAPLVLVYALLQNFFVKGIEASGITGE